MSILASAIILSLLLKARCRFSLRFVLGFLFPILLSQLRALAGQTAAYGLSSIVGRLLNYLLVPLYTRIFSPAEYGIVSEFYAYVTFLLVIYSYGMETAFFHFVNRKHKQENVYGHAQFLLVCTTTLLTSILLLFSGSIATAIGYPDHPEFIQWFAGILAIDTLCVLPFARLRQQGKAIRFAGIKLGGIAVNIAFNLFFLWILPGQEQVDLSGGSGASYVFLANLVASAVVFLFLVPALRDCKLAFDPNLSKEMFVYAIPLLVAGFAGMINETLDRAILKYLISDPRVAMEQLGIYSACYKLSILMTLFVQTFRYAAEPFYFAQQHKEESKRLFANVMNYFVFAGCVIFLVVLVYLDLFKHFIGPRYYSGLHVVPVLLAANLFLGIYLNMGIWYKLSGKTGYGAWLSLIGAIVTVVFNLWLIPVMGIAGAAWATLFCYLIMMVLSWLKGKEIYPVPYEIGKLIAMLLSAFALWQLFEFLRVALEWDAVRSRVFGGLILATFVGTFWSWLGGWKRFRLFSKTS